MENKAAAPSRLAAPLPPHMAGVAAYGPRLPTAAQGPCDGSQAAGKGPTKSGSPPPRQTSTLSRLSPDSGDWKWISPSAEKSDAQSEPALWEQTRTGRRGAGKGGAGLRGVSKSRLRGAGRMLCFVPTLTLATIFSVFQTLFV